jgi:hypothetical protein
VQSDPIGIDGGYNTYGYADANPLTTIDPSGLIKRNPKDKWADCGEEDMKVCREECGSRGVKSCKKWYKWTRELVGGKLTDWGYKPADKPSCNCNEICGAGCKGILVFVVGFGLSCFGAPEAGVPIMIGGAAAQ